jgi:hypothetical protein
MPKEELLLALQALLCVRADAAPCLHTHAGCITLVTGNTLATPLEQATPLQPAEASQWCTHRLLPKRR